MACVYDSSADSPSQVCEGAFAHGVTRRFPLGQALPSDSARWNTYTGPGMLVSLSRPCKQCDRRRSTVNAATDELQKRPSFNTVKQCCLSMATEQGNYTRVRARSLARMRAAMHVYTSSMPESCRIASCNLLQPEFVRPGLLNTAAGVCRANWLRGRTGPSVYYRRRASVRGRFCIARQVPDMRRRFSSRNRPLIIPPRAAFERTKRRFVRERIARTNEIGRVARQRDSARSFHQPPARVASSAALSSDSAE